MNQTRPQRCIVLSSVAIPFNEAPRPLSDPSRAMRSSPIRGANSMRTGSHRCGVLSYAGGMKI